MGLLEKTPVFGDPRERGRQYALGLSVQGRLTALQIAIEEDVALKSDESLKARLSRLRADLARQEHQKRLREEAKARIEARKGKERSG